MAPKGRKRKHVPERIEGAVHACVGRGLNASVSEKALGHTGVRKACGQERNQRADTPYGELIKEMPVELNDGSIYQAEYVCPFGLIRLASESSQAASDNFAAWLENKHCRIIMHLDEARLGNQLRPDKGRTFQSVHWNILEIPAWFRAREVGWFPFALLPGKVIDGANTSAMVRAMMHVFFSTSGFNFETIGVHLCKNNSTTVTYHVRASYRATICDEKAHKEVSSIKGASGRKCCGRCVNMLM
jgi:hypothetical protein